MAARAPGIGGGAGAGKKGNLPFGGQHDLPELDINTFADMRADIADVDVLNAPDTQVHKGFFNDFEDDFDDDVLLAGSGSAPTGPPEAAAEAAMEH
eukprot:m.485839 g.485839  ORF g.485839 m.485839 type:complete len:96 (-) comp24017_c0_seq1:180-467(-)